jgi:hypothetical protein
MGNMELGTGPVVNRRRRAGKDDAMDDDKWSQVLLDVPTGDGSFDRDILERLGHPVTMCPGPTERKPCPILYGKACAKFEGAHGIVFELDLDKPEHRAILGQYRALRRDGHPIRAVVRPDQARRYAELLGDVEVWTHEPNVADLDGFAAEVESVDRFG